MAKKQERDLSRIGWLDYFLTAIGSCLAVYSGGMSIQQPTVGYFSVALVIVGTLTSYLIRIQIIRSPIIKLDGFIYSIAVICAIYFSADLSTLMPENGFPREIAAAGWLSWMLILGSFVTWQDSTILFQAIPSLALFGLVGCYDTYRNVTFNFFAFLMCLATLFARAHGRQMLRNAAQSGYFTRGLAPGTPIPSVETTPGLALQLKAGPWRWVAGPEWALFSALAVVLLSLLGAPIIRESVSGVAGLVTLSPPPIKNQPAATAASNDASGNTVRIGRGPNHNSPRPVLEARLDKPRYLREQSFMMYTGKGWRNVPIPVASQQGQATPTDAATLELKNTVNFEFGIKLLQALKYLPLPAEVLVVSPEDGGSISSHDGTFEISSATPYETKVLGKSLEPAPGVKPTDVVTGPEMVPLLDSSNIPLKVAELASEVSKNSTNDFEKAEKISDEISRRIVYNLDADATPAERDPVEYALFEKHESYCDIYASAMVVMARAAGLPARYVQGYLPDSRRLQPDGTYILTNQDYHAWAEIMFKNVGWVVFDPTIKATAKEGEGLGDAGDQSPWYRRGSLLVATNALIVVILMGMAGVGYRHFKGIKRVVNARSEIERSYLTFGKRMEHVSGRRRLVGQTADEFLESVRPSLGSTYETAKELNERFVTLLYGSESVSDESVFSIRQDVKSFFNLLKAEPNKPRIRPT